MTPSLPDPGHRRQALWPTDPAVVYGLAPSSEPLIADLAATALEAATAAALILLEGLHMELAVDTKTSATDMVSEVDVRAEAAVAAVLSDRRPDDSILGEEGTVSSGSTSVRWVVDPLDGTTNYLFGIPQFAVSVAAEIAGEAAVGVVIDPSRGEIWAATRGHGARLNGLPCQVATGRSALETALVATGFGYQSARRAWQSAVLARVLPAVRDVRRLGSAALDLCWTAGGRYDAYYEWGLNPWDLAAGALICQEAGGRVEALPGRLILATPHELFEPMRQLLSAAGGLEAPAGDEPAHW